VTTGCHFRTIRGPSELASRPLIGGNKPGNDRWHDEFVPVADRLYDAYLEALRGEGLV
jgi:hypothetical protein